jgi:hypothetical protein
MATWKLSGEITNLHRASIEWCVAHSQSTNFMYVGWDDRFRVALLGPESNIGRSSRLFSDVTAKLPAPSDGTAGIPVNSDVSVWTAYAEAVTAGWEVLYGVDGLGGGLGEIVAYRQLANSADVEVLEIDTEHNCIGPFTYANLLENIDIVNGAVPVGATQWRFKAFGGGGGGGGGKKAASGTTPGGTGGGGAAYVDTGWQSVAVLGSTYSVTRGLGGVGGAVQPAGLGSGDGSPGSNGGASSFTSGSVSLTAGGGGGAPGATTATNLAGGDGGTASIRGVSATAVNGTAGGRYNSTTPNNTSGGGAGGGAGAGFNSSGTTIVARAGGNSTTGSGGAAATSGNGGDGPDQSAGNAGPGGGGAAVGGNFVGGSGGNYGGGGGGGGAFGATSAGTNTAGNGGDGYTIVEWA